MNSDKCAACGAEIPVTFERIMLKDGAYLCCSCEGATRRVFKIELGGPGNGLICDTLQGLQNEIEMLFQEGVEGDTLTISVEKMKVSAIHALPEHGGW